MRSYKVLNNINFTNENFKLIPLRDSDKYEILEIRNQQIYHLRQTEQLTKEKQDNYFSNVVANLFEQEKPNQLLFSFLENDEFIGYGGLVHISWIDRNAEISFVMKTELEKDNFQKYWSNYLKLIEKVAFGDLNFHKTFTYAFDLRPHLYKVLEFSGFKEEARLKEHCFFENKYLDVVYHCKINRNITFRKASESDLMLYFDWTNDESVRENSYKSDSISLENHVTWFKNKISDQDCLMLVFENHLNQPIGQVRIQKQLDKSALIGISNDVNHRGKGYASKMIALASEEFLKENHDFCISAYIKLENTASEKAFQKAGYTSDTVTYYEEIPSHHYIKTI